MLDNELEALDRDANGENERRARLRIVKAEDVQLEPTAWLMRDRIPQNELAIFDGDGGIGKTTNGTVTLYTAPTTNGPVNITGGTLKLNTQDVIPTNFTGYGTSLPGYQDYFTTATRDPGWVPLSGAGGALVWQGTPVTETGGAGDTFIPLNVSTDFFSSGGFAKISLTAAGINLPAGVVLTPTVTSLVIGNTTAVSGSITSVATPVLLGGPRFQMMGPLLFWAFATDNNWRFAAAIAFVLMGTTLGLTGLDNIVIPARYWPR